MKAFLRFASPVFCALAFLLTASPASAQQKRPISAEARAQLEILSVELNALLEHYGKLYNSVLDLEDQLASSEGDRKARLQEVLEAGQARLGKIRAGIKSHIAEIGEIRREHGLEWTNESGERGAVLLSRS